MRITRHFPPRCWFYLVQAAGSAAYSTLLFVSNHPAIACVFAVCFILSLLTIRMAMQTEKLQQETRRLIAELELYDMGTKRN